MPTTPCKGVRISWLITARNPALALTAASASSREAASSAVRRSTRCFKQLCRFLQGLILLLDLGVGALQLDRAVVHHLRQGVHLLEGRGLLHFGRCPAPRARAAALSWRNWRDRPRATP